MALFGGLQKTISIYVRNGDEVRHEHPVRTPISMRTLGKLKWRLRKQFPGCTVDDADLVAWLQRQREK